MRDDEGRPARRETLEPLQDQGLGLRVQRRGRLVQDQDRRVAHERAGDGDSLLFTLGERDALLAHDRVVAIRQRHDRVVDAGQARGRHDLVEPGVRPAERDVVADAERQHERRLQDHGDLPAERRQPVLAHVHAVDEDPASGRVVEARKQAEQGRLAGACRADDRHRLARLDAKAHVAQDRVAARVLEGGAFPRDLTPRAGRGEIAASVRDLALDVEQIEDALYTDGRALGEPPGLEHAVDGAVERGEIRDEHDERADAQRAVEDVPRAHPDDRGGAQRDHDVDDAPVEGLERVEPQAVGEAPLAGGHEATVLVVFSREGLDHAHGRHRPLHDRVDLALALPELARRPGDAAVEPRDDDEERGAHREGQQSQRRVEPDHDAAHSDQQHRRRHRGKQAVHGQGLEREGVRGDAVEQVADARAPVEGERQPVQVRVQVAAQVVHHALTDLDRRVVAQHVQGADDGVEGHYGETRGEEHRRGRPSAGPVPGQRLPAEHRIDDDLQRPGLEQLARADEQRQDERPCEPRPVGGQIGEDAAGDPAHFARAGGS